MTIALRKWRSALQKVSVIFRWLTSNHQDQLNLLIFPPKYRFGTIGVLSSCDVRSRIGAGDRDGFARTLAQCICRCLFCGCLFIFLFNVKFRSAARVRPNPQGAYFFRGDFAQLARRCRVHYLHVKSEISVYRGGYEMNRMNTFGVHYVLVFLLGNFSLLMIFLFPFSKFPHTPYRCSAL